MTSPTNLQRAAWAETAILAFKAVCPTDDHDVLCDLLCGLMHWANYTDYTFDCALDRARDHFQAEVEQ